MATINAGSDQLVVRNVERIKTLKSAMAKPGASAERKASLQAEYDRRMGELQTVKDALAQVDAL